jgi:riboflavin synthase
MFTGIVETTATVQAVSHHSTHSVLTLNVPDPYTSELAIGASMSVNGVCLTVTQVHGETVEFDIIIESLARTTLATLAVGDKVNIERSLRANAEVGGHIMSGHIDGTAIVTHREEGTGNVALMFTLEPHLNKYVFNKGFIGVHGTSLTAGQVDQLQGTFTVWLIPETLRKTNLSNLRCGDKVNIEVHRETQVAVDTIERVLNEMITTGNVTPEMAARIRECVQLGNH